MVSRSILEPGHYTGFYPLAKNADWEKSAAIVRNLPTMREKIKQIEKHLKTTNLASNTATNSDQNHE
jgi:UDP-3-O-[3-hydroxymyristoyl] glucosamine N-acyltransferase